MATSRVSSRASRGRYADTTRFTVTYCNMSYLYCFAQQQTNYCIFQTLFCYYCLSLVFFYCSSSSREGAKEEAMALIKLYFNQITKGCGQEDCENEQCASSKHFKYDQISNDEAAAKAVHLFKSHSKLCVPNYKNHRVAKPLVVETQEDVEYSVPVQETGGRGGASQVGAIYTKAGAKITSNAAKPGKKNFYVDTGRSPCLKGSICDIHVCNCILVVVVLSDFLVANMHTYTMCPP